MILRKAKLHVLKCSCCNAGLWIRTTVKTCPLCGSFLPTQTE